MKIKPCQRAFQSSSQQRALYPLRSGRYKLREAHAYLLKMSGGFKEIVRFRAIKPKPKYLDVDLGGFLAWETPSRLRKTPMLLVEIAAYYVLPGLKALTGDGVAQTEIDEEVHYFELFLDRFIERCDTVVSDLRGPISKEYARLEDGSSELIWLTKSLEREAKHFLDL